MWLPGAVEEHKDMGRARKAIARRKDARRSLEALFDSAHHVYLLHYTCEDFKKGQSPRITSIALRNLESGQTVAYSFHLIAEEKKIDNDHIQPKYDEIERTILESFYLFVKRHTSARYLHWNMRDTNFGFEALEHRYRILGGDPVPIQEANKFDLSRILVAIYGTGYTEHPRFESLMKRNDITDRDFLPGAEEPAAFARKEFYRLHLSVLRKVDVLANVAERAMSGQLKTKRYIREVYGSYPYALLEYLREHPLIAALLILVSLVGSVYSVLAYYQANEVTAKEQGVISAEGQPDE